MNYLFKTNPLKFLVISLFIFGFYGCNSESDKVVEYNKQLEGGLVFTFKQVEVEHIDFGEMVKMRRHISSFELKQNGSFDVTNLSVDAFNEDDPFQFTDGKYPGKNGTCGSVLKSGESCTLELEFYPKRTQKYEQQARLKYNGGMGAKERLFSIKANAGAAGNLKVVSGLLNFGIIDLSKQKETIIEVKNTGDLKVIDFSYSIDGGSFFSSTSSGAGKACKTEFASNESCFIKAILTTPSVLLDSKGDPTQEVLALEKLHFEYKTAGSATIVKDELLRALVTEVAPNLQFVQKIDYTDFIEFDTLYQELIEQDKVSASLIVINNGIVDASRVKPCVYGMKVDGSCSLDPSGFGYFSAKFTPTSTDECFPDLVDPTSFSIPASKTCTLEITFNPRSPGDFNAILGRLRYYSKLDTNFTYPITESFGSHGTGTEKPRFEFTVNSTNPFSGRYGLFGYNAYESRNIQITNESEGKGIALIDDIYLRYQKDTDSILDGVDDINITTGVGDTLISSTLSNVVDESPYRMESLDSCGGAAIGYSGSCNFSAAYNPISSTKHKDKNFATIVVKYRVQFLDGSDYTFQDDIINTQLEGISNASPVINILKEPTFELLPSINFGDALSGTTSKQLLRIRNVGMGGTVDTIRLKLTEDDPGNINYPFFKFSTNGCLPACDQANCSQDADYQQCFAGCGGDTNCESSCLNTCETKCNTSCQEYPVAGCYRSCDKLNCSIYDSTYQSCFSSCGGDANCEVGCLTTCENSCTTSCGNLSSTPNFCRGIVSPLGDVLTLSDLEAPPEQPAAPAAPYTLTNNECLVEVELFSPTGNTGRKSGSFNLDYYSPECTLIESTTMVCLDDITGNACINGAPNCTCNSSCEAPADRDLMVLGQVKDDANLTSVGVYNFGDIPYGISESSNTLPTKLNISNAGDFNAKIIAVTILPDPAMGGEDHTSFFSVFPGPLIGSYILPDSMVGATRVKVDFTPVLPQTLDPSKVFGAKLQIQYEKYNPANIGTLEINIRGTGKSLPRLSVLQTDTNFGAVAKPNQVNIVGDYGACVTRNLKIQNIATETAEFVSLPNGEQEIKTNPLNIQGFSVYKVEKYPASNTSNITALCSYPNCPTYRQGVNTYCGNEIQGGNVCNIYLRYCAEAGSSGAPSFTLNYSYNSPSASTEKYTVAPEIPTSFSALISSKAFLTVSPTIHNYGWVMLDDTKYRNYYFKNTSATKATNLNVYDTNDNWFSGWGYHLRDSSNSLSDFQIYYNDCSASNGMYLNKSCRIGVQFKPTDVYKSNYGTGIKVTYEDGGVCPDVYRQCISGVPSCSSGGSVDSCPIADLRCDNLSLECNPGDPSIGIALSSFSGKVYPPIAYFKGWKDVKAVGNITDKNGTVVNSSYIKITANALSPRFNFHTIDHYKIYRKDVTQVNLSGWLWGGGNGLHVGTVSAGGDIVFTDNQNIVDGMAYYYRIVPFFVGSTDLASNVWGSPIQDQVLRVVTPPSNMAFIHRLMANKHTCERLGLPNVWNNNYSCNYNGFGNNAGKINFVKDMFVDVHELGVVDAPSKSYNNFYDLPPLMLNARSDLNVDDHTGTTYDPYDLCIKNTASFKINNNVQTVNKRSLSRIEYMIASAWDPAVLDNASKIASMEQGLDLDGSGNADSNNCKSGTVFEFDPTYENTGKRPGCVSRYGIKDMVGNAWELVYPQGVNSSFDTSYQNFGTNGYPLPSGDLTGFQFPLTMQLQLERLSSNMAASNFTCINKVLGIPFTQASGVCPAGSEYLNSSEYERFYYHGPFMSSLYHYLLVGGDYNNDLGHIEQGENIEIIGYDESVLQNEGPNVSLGGRYTSLWIPFIDDNVKIGLRCMVEVP